MEVLKTKEERYLRYDFNAEEYMDLTKKLANKTKELESVQSEKKSIVAQYASQIASIEGETQSLATKVASGYEMRKVECVIRYHFPEQNKKQITRTDTGEKIIEKMLPEDHNLWNQAPDSERELHKD